MPDEILERNFRMNAKQSLNDLKSARICGIFIVENQNFCLLSADWSCPQTGVMTLIQTEAPLSNLFQTPFTRSVEFENGIKKCLLASRLHDAGRISKFFVSVSNTAKFVILPFSNSAGIVYSHFTGRILCGFRHEDSLILSIVLIVVVVSSILIDYRHQLLLPMELA